MLYRVAWKDLMTGIYGYDPGFFDEEEARHISDGMNKKYLKMGVVHWIAPVEEVTVDSDEK